MTDQATRRKAEAARIAAVRKRGAVPPALAGLGYGDAPARGAFRVVSPVAAYPKGDSDYDYKETGGRVMVMADVFDRMMQHAVKRNRTCGLTQTMVEMGRTYRNLCELQAGQAGPRSCLADNTGGGGGVADVAGATLDVSRRLDLLRRRIGTGVAMEVRRKAKRPRHPISDRHLVDAVCIGDQDISAIAVKAGWHTAGRVDGTHIKAMTQALATTLVRMMGPVHGNAGHHMRLGDAPRWPDQG